MTAAERAFDPGPGWRHATVYDKPLPDTYLAVHSQGTQQFWVPDGEPGFVAGDPVKFASPWGDIGYGTVRVVKPERVLVAIDPDEVHGGQEQWFKPADVTKMRDDEERP